MLTVVIPVPQTLLVTFHSRVSLLKSLSGLSIRGSGQPISPVSATTEGDDATMATPPRVLWRRQHEQYAFFGALSFVLAGGNRAEQSVVKRAVQAARRTYS